jgi:hypothetical protein
VFTDQPRPKNTQREAVQTIRNYEYKRKAVKRVSDSHAHTSSSPFCRSSSQRRPPSSSSVTSSWSLLLDPSTGCLHIQQKRSANTLMDSGSGSTNKTPTQRGNRPRPVFRLQSCVGPSDLHLPRTQCCLTPLSCSCTYMSNKFSS